MRDDGAAFRGHRRLFLLTLLVVLIGLGPGWASRLGSGLRAPGVVFSGDAIELERVDVNRAPAPALETLPGIGPVLAERMVAERDRNGPFAGPSDLTRVKGIGPATADRIAPYITFTEEAASRPGG